MAEKGKPVVSNEDIAEGSAWEIEDQFEEFEGKWSQQSPLDCTLPCKNGHSSYNNITKADKTCRVVKRISRLGIKYTLQST